MGGAPSRQRFLCSDWGCISARTLDTDTKRLTRLFSARADGRGAVFDRGLTDAVTKEAGFSAQDITKEPGTSDAPGSFVFSGKLLFLGFHGLTRNLVFHFGFILFLVALGGGVGVLGGVDGRGHGGAVSVSGTMPPYTPGHN